MQPIRLDHFITYTSSPSIEEHLERYRLAGFRPLERTTRHDPGLRNGFLGFGPEYVEFCWVEDEQLFCAGDAEERALRAATRPFGIGIVTPDVHALHHDWTARGLEVPPVWSKAPRDAAPDTSPVWSFQEIPRALQPGGVSCFLLTYHTLRPGAAVSIPPNTVYAIAGITFVTPEPRARAHTWGNLFAPDTPLATDGDACSVAIGPHLATFMNPAHYEQRYSVSWNPSPHAYGEIALLHLLAEHLPTAEAMLAAAGRTVTRIEAASGRSDSLFVAADPRDGFAYLVTERPAAEWIAWRNALTGEQLAL